MALIAKFSRTAAPAQLLKPTLLSTVAAVAFGAITLFGQFGPASASDINSMMSDDAAATTQSADPGASAGNTALGATPTGDNDLTLGADTWIKSKSAIGHLNIIAARPLPNETCQNVIFDARPYLKERHEPKAGGQLSFKMNALCLMGFRNDSDTRKLVIRLGENLETMAIAPDPQLFSGLVVAPGQQVMIALRPLPVTSLDVGLEVVWEDDLDSLTPEISKTTLTVSQ